jgi:integrase
VLRDLVKPGKAPVHIIGACLDCKSQTAAEHPALSVAQGRATPHCASMTCATCPAHSSPKRAQEILGHADVRTTVAIYTHAMRRRHDDSADKMAELAASRLSEAIGKQMAP